MSSRINRELVPYEQIDTADAETLKCVQLSERDLLMLLSQTRYLYWTKRYVVENTSIEVSRETVTEWASTLEARLLAAADCEVEQIACCEQFTPEQSWVAFFPNDPFTTPELVPSGYLLPPFYTNPLVPIAGVLATDAMLNFAAIPLFQSWADLLETGLPRCVINFQGSGQVEVELVKIPQGGFAALTVDGSLASMQIVNLTEFSITDFDDLQEFVELPLDGLVQTEIVEFEVETTGNHTLEITFLPNVGVDIILGFGGGLRSIEFCNGTSAGEAFTMQMRTVAAGEGCNLIQWRPASSGLWVDLLTVCDGADGAAGADAPPLHMAFDAANCRLMYTQGDINSPYEGGDWNTVFDWNIASLKTCLGLVGSVGIPDGSGITTARCDIAWGMASILRAEVLELVEYDLANGPYASKFTFAVALLNDGSFWFGSDWNYLPVLMNWAASYTSPSVGMTDEIAAADTLLMLAQAIYCSLSDTANPTLNRDELETQLNTYDAIFNTNASSALYHWITRQADERLQRILLDAAANTTGSDCAALDCYLLPACFDYADEMIGGLGNRTRLFDANHAWARDVGNVQSDVVSGAGISGGDAVRMVHNNGGGGGGLWVGGFFIDLGHECGIAGASVSYKIDTSPVNASIDIDYRDGDGALLSNAHFSVSGTITTSYQTAARGSYGSGVRYVVFRADSQAYAGVGSQILLANPSVDVS